MKKTHGQKLPILRYELLWGKFHTEFQLFCELCFSLNQFINVECIWTNFIVSVWDIFHCCNENNIRDFQLCVTDEDDFSKPSWLPRENWKITIRTTLTTTRWGYRQDVHQMNIKREETLSWQRPRALNRWFKKSCSIQLFFTYLQGCCQNEQTSKELRRADKSHINLLAAPSSAIAPADRIPSSTRTTSFNFFHRMKKKRKNEIYV